MSSAPIISHIDRASFTIWSKDDIKKISVKQLTEPKSFEKAGKMHPEGLYSNALGSVNKFDLCGTCGMTNFSCPGHYGHIELSVPVYHPLLVQVVYQIISKCCLECFHFRLSQSSLKLFLAQLEALNCGFDYLIDELNEIASDMIKDKTGGDLGAVNDDKYLPVALATKLKNRIEVEKEKTPNFDCAKRPQQRNIVERLSKLFRNFINGTLIKPVKICPNCGEKKTSVSLHQQSVLVVGSGSGRPLNDGVELKHVLTKAKKRKESKLRDVKKQGLNYICTESKTFMTPLGARYVLRELWKNERRTLERIFHFLNLESSNEESVKVEHDTAEDNEEPKKKSKKRDEFQPIDLFFIDTILVPPSKFRPPMSQRGYSFEGPRTAALSNVMKCSIVVQDILDQIVSETEEDEVEKLQPKLQTSWKALQTAVNCLYDNEMDKYGKNKYPGLKQLIDKKEGLFRKNMMGKRVNFAARSVISPDPNISVDQIGVPLVFAMKLTYPEPVTPWNIDKLREAVLNGPTKYPGAMSVVFDDDRTISLVKEPTRIAIASRLSYDPRSSRNYRKQEVGHRCMIVNRHLVTGDVLLFNRQPTLHKASIMAFRARVLPNEKGFRLHYANCKSFNADFDGDEMNAHLPQSELARSEAYNIASVNYQYLVPKDGTPLGGLIQDHVVSACIMTKRDMFYDKERYDQLVFCSLGFLDKPLKLENPAIYKPVPLWTGKQIMTTIIKNCIPEGRLPPTLNIKSKIGPKMMNIKPKDEKLSDCHVIIRNGELLTGFIDKSNIGGTQYGLVHICYELYGGETSSNIMSAFARLATWYLQLYEGFTLGIADILVEDDANEDRRKLISESLTVGPDSAKEALGITGEVAQEVLENKLRDAHSDRNPLPMKKLDAAMKTRTDKIASKISSRCLPEGLIRRFPDNNLQMMIQSGAKGGTVNALQISCLLGQIELEGRRVPLSMSGRSLPSFKPYDTSPKAGGFVSGRFLTGIQPQEFFFHCMAGREGLIDTAVKTSRSGYLQRCLIKHLEGLTVQYDQTVRDSCGSVIQFLYGEDGLDIVKCQLLKEKAFPALIDNHKVISPSEDELEKLTKAKEAYEDEVIAITNSIQSWQENNGDDKTRKLRGSGFLDFLATKMLDIDYTLDVGLDATTSDVDTNDEEKLESGEVKEEHKSDKSMDFDEIEKIVNQSAVTDAATVNPSETYSHPYQRIFAAWYDLSFKEKKRWNKSWESCPDPLIALMNPASHFGVVPERLDDIIGAFVRDNPQLIVNSASLLGANLSNNSESSQTNEQQLHEQQIASSSYMDCDVNPELSKSILAHCNQSMFTGGNRSGCGNNTIDQLLDKPKLTKHEFYNLCYNLYMKMLAQPGEAVGLLAAQSIGEPSTQMTLNTFHFAGRGEMNVTLGIPRLREILMTASAKIGTPSMDLPLLKVMKDEFGKELDVDGIEEQAKRVKLALNAVRLSDVLEYVDITERTITGKALPQAAAQGRESKRKRVSGNGSGKNVKESKLQMSSTKSAVQYEIEFHLLSSKYYKHEFKSKSSTVMKFIEEVFVDQLVDSMVKRQKRLLRAEEMFDVSTKRMNKERATKTAKELKAENELEEQELDDYNAKVKAKEKVKEDDSSSEEEDEGEGDNTTQRLKSRRNADLDYEEPEDDDLEVGDVEAVTAEAEEGDKEILADTDELQLSNGSSEAAAGAGEVGAQHNQKLNEQQEVRAPGDQDDENDDDDDQVSEKVKLELAAEQELERKPAGKNIELAGFEDVFGGNSRSGFVTPTHADDDDSFEASNEEPAKKKKRIDPSAVAKAIHEMSATASNSYKSKRRLDEHEIELRINQVICKPYVMDYSFDVRKQRWCKLKVCVDLTTTRLDMGALIEAEAKRTYVHRVGNIQRALIVKDVAAKSRGAKCDKMIKTEGVSLLSLVRFNHILDLNAIYSNDIHAIANTYGIEAAAQAIRREMANVFAVYGIEVDSRHLSLIADYMTYSGSIRGMNRMSMEASASPFQQMSYESTIRYLKWAAILGLYDDIKSPSASLVFGKPTRGGTGLFGLMSTAEAPTSSAAKSWSSTSWSTTTATTTTTKAQVASETTSWNTVPTEQW